MNRKHLYIIHNSCMVLAFSAIALLMASDPFPRAGGEELSVVAKVRPFLAAKTLFQTNRPYDPRLAIAVDAVIVHRHGAVEADVRHTIGSWKERGYSVGRMFFADSDAGNHYWQGKWDGKKHPDEVERDAQGKVVRAGTRPYMLPSEGWIRYLEDMTRQSIAAGADAILPEEPLAHAHTGYEKSFRKLWRKRYGQSWRPESESAEARFLTGQLKNERYLELERRLAALTARQSRCLGRDISFILPVHSLYSNAAANLVAPLGSSLSIPHIDGMIGQVWTGPVRWALANYNSRQKSFFSSAYALYDYFVAMTTHRNRKLWLLVDPVEDDPNHQWSEFEAWYRHSVVASLLFPQVDAYEVMPWPDRIFLPGHTTGGGTPAPERNRIAILSAIQVQQEVPPSGRWILPAGGPAGVGIGVSDTLLWQRASGPRLQAMYGMILPLVEAGVLVTACVAERANEEDYLDSFRVIVLSRESWNPANPDANRALVRWVRRGGTLILLGRDEPKTGKSYWWRQLGYPSALQHLLAEAGWEGNDQGERSLERGRIWCRQRSSRSFAEARVAKDFYLPLTDRGLKAAGVDQGLETPGGFILRRGPFVIAHATGRPLDLPGQLLDIFAPDLPVYQGVHLEVGQSGLYREVDDILGRGESAPVRLLHTTHRLVEQEWEEGALCLGVRGPAKTPAVLRLHAPTGIRAIEARAANGAVVAVEQQVDGATVLLRFANDPEGVLLRIKSH